MSTIQAQHEAAKKLADQLKNFFISEGNGAKNATVSTNSLGKLLAVHVDFHHKNEKDRMLSRIVQFGFPKINSESKTNIVFNNFDTAYELKKARSISNEKALIKNDSLASVYQTLTSWITTKGFKHRTCKGTDFVRIQGASFAKTAVVFLSSQFSKVYSFDRAGEDIYIFPVGEKQHAASQHTEEEPKDFLENVIRDIFGIEIYESDEANGEVIIGFSSEDIAQSTKVLCDEYILTNSKRCTVNGQTIVFPKLEGNHNSFDEIKEFYELHKSTHDEKKLQADEITDQAFYTQVRDYVRNSSDCAFKTPSSMSIVNPYEYRIGLSGNIDGFIEKMQQDNPHWSIRRAHPTSVWIVVILTGKNDVKKIEVPRSNDTTTEGRLNKLRRSKDSPAATRSEVNDAIRLIENLGKQFGLSFKKSAQLPSGHTFQNGRAIYWDNDSEHITKAMHQFTSLGYLVSLKRVSTVFESIFPEPIGSNQHDEGISPSAVHEEKLQDAVVEHTGIKISVEVPKEAVTHILRSVSDSEFLEEISRRKLDDSAMFLHDKVSNEELIAEIKRRGPDFGQQLFKALFSS